MKATSCLKSNIAKSVLFSMLLIAGIAGYTQPTAGFSGTNLSGCAPILARFTDESAGNPTYWKWDLGNGTISYLQHPSVTYFVPGTYHVKLIVKNAAGQDSLVKTNYVQVFAAPVVDFTASQTSGCDSVTAQFTDRSNAARSWQWDFGDGVFSSEHNPVHTYAQTGNYNVSLKVINGEGCSLTLVKQAYINVNSAKADFGFTVPLRCSPTRVHFENNSYGNGRRTSKWYFGNGDSSVTASPVYIYPSGGTYTVKLAVSNEFGCTDTVSTGLTLSKPVSAVFSADIVSSCTAPVTVRFTNQELLHNNYTWDFGDTSYSAVSSPVHVFKDTGSYTVKLIVRNSNGCADSLVQRNYIKVQKPFVSLANLPDSGCTGMQKHFSAVSVGTDSITSYLWNFGDGTTSLLPDPAHIFSGERYFAVSLITTGASGCRDTTVFENAIRTGNKPVAAFSSQIQEACSQTPVQFTDNTQGRVTQWQWNFGDNGQAFDQHPQYRFSDTGYMAAELIAFNGGCTDTLTRPRFVYIKPSVAKLKFDFNCENPFRFSFTNLALGADSWLWNFGDGNTSAERHPVHTYTDTGLYTVSLTTYNNTTGCSAYKSKTLMTTKVLPGFFASDSVICKGRSTTFTSTVANGEVNRFIWYFGDGSFESTLENTITHEYAEPGEYTVSLVTINRVNCRDSVVKAGYISVKSVKANFGLPVPVVCSGSSMVFSDSSLASTGSRIQSWQWSYGDGQTDTLTSAPFSHVYAARGTYVVTLKVTDNNGCFNSFTSSVPVTVKKVLPAFFAFDSVKCTNNEIMFVCPFAEPGVTYRWDFGDGGTAGVQIPRHAYDHEGLYYVKLKVGFQQLGCEDSFALPYPITIENPVARFSISDSFRNCPPLIVQFTNESYKAADELWNFGYGTAIYANNPSHFYSYPGVYTASLTVSGRGGCTSTMQRTIAVKGPKGALTYGPHNFCQAPANVTFAAVTTDATSFTWDFNDGTTITNSDSVVTHLYDNPGNFVPKLMLVDNEGCRVPVQGRDTISLTQTEARFSFADTTACSNGQVSFINTTLSADSIVSYRWSFGDGNHADNIENPSHNYSAEGLYYPTLKVITAGGCTDSFTTAVPVRVAFSPDISMNSSVNEACMPQTISFTGVANSPQMPATAWQWDFANGNMSDTQNPAPQVFLSAGNYNVTLTATGSNGCKKTITKNILIHALPNVVISGRNSICRGESTTLTAAGAQSYEWLPAEGQTDCVGCASALVTPVLSGDYIVKGISEFGCIAYDTVTVKVAQPFTLAYTNTAKVCAGANVQLNVSGADLYEWIPAAGLSNSSAASPVAQPAVTTQYKVIGKDANGCFKDSGLITVKVNELPSVNAGEDKTLTAGASVELIPVVSADVTEVTWSPTGGIFRNGEYAVTVKPLTTTEYTAVVKNADGCVAADKVTVAVTNNDHPGGLFIPNTFSPNGDGANDIFYPRSGTGIKVNRLKIMNRHGITVFDKTNFYTNDAASGWDGRIKGSKPAIDVYVYVIEIISNNGQTKVLSGNISLVL